MYLNKALISDKAASKVRKRLKAFKANEIDEPEHQAGGRVSASGGAGREENPARGRGGGLDAPRNERKAAPAAGMKAAHKLKGSPSATKAPVAPSGPRYGGGSRSTQ